MTSKRHHDNKKEINFDKVFSGIEAIELIQKGKTVKFDQTVEMNLVTGIDPKKSDQQVRGTVILPHGTGKALRVVVIAKGDKVKEALDAGAQEAGEEILERIKGGWTDFDVLIVTPDMMREVGKLGKVLGPRGLMPTPKAGTVATDVAKAVAEVMKGKVEFKVDKSGVINLIIGKLSFAKEQLIDNLSALLSAINKAKPVSAKGQYLKKLHLSSTMGIGLKVDINSVLQG